MKKNLLQISNIMFKDRNKWSTVTNEEKESFFFIFNRYFSKKYPNTAQLINSKEIDPVIGMNLWFNFMYPKPYPQWFWSKVEKIKSESEEDVDLKKWEISLEEWELLKKYYPEEVKEELKWLKQLQK